MAKRTRGHRAGKDYALRFLRRHQRSLLLVAAVLLLLIILLTSVSSCSKKKEEADALAALETTVSRLESENTRLRSELDAATAAAGTYEKDLADTVRAMDLFWQIDEAFVLNRNSRARELIRILEAETLSSALPTQSTTDNGRFSPYDRYAEICQALGESYGAPAQN